MSHAARLCCQGVSSSHSPCVAVCSLLALPKRLYEAIRYQEMMVNQMQADLGLAVPESQGDARRQRRSTSPRA